MDRIGRAMQAVPMPPARETFGGVQRRVVTWYKAGLTGITSHREPPIFLPLAIPSCAKPSSPPILSLVSHFSALGFT